MPVESVQIYTAPLPAGWAGERQPRRSGCAMRPRLSDRTTGLARSDARSRWRRSSALWRLLTRGLGALGFGRCFGSCALAVLRSPVRSHKARLFAASAKRNGPVLIGLELRNKKAVLTFDRNCELLDCGRVRFSLAAGLDSPHVLNPPASDDVYGPANSHGRSVINTSIPANGRVGKHRHAFCGLYPTRSAASAATPPKKHLRAAYCRKNQ